MVCSRCQVRHHVFCVSHVAFVMNCAMCVYIVHVNTVCIQFSRK